MTNILNAYYRRITAAAGTPVFIYSEERLRRNVGRIRKGIRDAGLKGRMEVNAAYFANSQPTLFRILGKLGVGAVLQRREELAQILATGEGRLRMHISPGVMSDEDIEHFVHAGIPLNVNTLEELEYALCLGGDVGIRVDLTPQQEQRTGLKREEFAAASDIASKHGTTIKRIHTYPGTGSEVGKLIEHARITLRSASEFQDVTIIDLGGGFAYDYERSRHFPWRQYCNSLARLLEEEEMSSDVRLWIEPGREIFADAGELLLRVNRVNRRASDTVQRVHTDGTYTLMPSAMIRKRQHNVAWLDRDYAKIKEEEGHAELQGCTTLSSDWILPGVVRAPSRVMKGSYLVIRDIGAYGASQHLEFLNVPPAAEAIVMRNGEAYMLARRGPPIDRLRHTLTTPERIQP